MKHKPHLSHSKSPTPYLQGYGWDMGGDKGYAEVNRTTGKK